VLVTATAGLVIVAGVTPSPLLPPLPDGVAPPASLGRLARSIGLDGIDSGAATLRASLLVGIAVIAFLALCLLAWNGRLSTRAAVWTALGLIAAVTFLPPLLSRDVYSYASYGRIWAVWGSNPYVHPPLEFRQDPFIYVVSGEWIDARSVYGPAFTIASGGIVRAFGSVAGTVFAFKALASIAAAATVVIAVRLAERVRPGRGAFAAVLLGLNPVILFHTVGGAHNDVLVGLAVVGALALWGRRPLAATAVLTLGTLVKLVAAVPLGLALGAVWLRAGPRLRDRLRATWPHLALAAGITAVLFAPFGYSRATLSSFATLVSRLGWASPVRLLVRKAGDAGTDLGGGIGVGEAVAALTQAGFTALGLGVLFLILRRILRGDRRVGPAEAWGWGLLVTSLCAAYLLPWYVVWFLPALALTTRPVPIVVGISVSSLLALTGIPAEPSFDSGVWSAMILTVHYVVAPIMLGVLVASLLDLRTVLLARR
jgi:hypothetical protein